MGDIKELKRIMNEKLAKEGWDSFTQFARKSGVNVSAETIRRVLSPDYVDMEPWTLARILFALGFRRNEIRDLLREHTSDEVLWRLIGNDTEKVDNFQRTLLNAVEKITQANPDLMPRIADNLSLMAELAKVQIEEELALLSRPRGK